MKRTLTFFLLLLAVFSTYATILTPLSEKSEVSMPTPTCTIAPSITFSGATVFCAGNSVVLGTSSAYVSYAWSTSVVTPTITVTSSGTYIVTVTDGSGCTGTASQLVTVYPLPTVDYTGLPATVCYSSGNHDLSGSPFGGSYTGPGMTGYTFNAGNIPDGTYTITYYYSDYNGCVSTAAHSVTVEHPAPIITSSSSPTFCDGDSVTLSVGSFATYLWNTGGTTNTITVNSPGNFIVSATTINGCTGTTSQNVIVNPLPAVSFSGLPAIACYNSGNFQLIGIPAGGNFYGAGITGSTFQTSLFSPLYAGNDTITYYYQDANGCYNYQRRIVNISTLPTGSITANGPISFCQGDSVMLTATGGTAYHWNTLDSTSNITVTNSGNYVVTLTGTNGCTSTTLLFVSVHPVPVVSFTGLPASVCSNAGNITLTGTPTGGSFYGAGISSNLFNPLNVAPGMDSIEYYYNNGYCFGIIKHGVMVNLCTGMEELNLISGIELYPNPNNGSFSLTYHLTAPKAEFSIFDITGRLVYTHTLTSSIGKEDLHLSLSEGVYLWQLKNEKEVLEKGKILLNR